MRLIHNIYYRTTVKALRLVTTVYTLPLHWWWSWLRLLYHTRQWPRLWSIEKITTKAYRMAYSQTFIIDVDWHRRLKRFNGDKAEVWRSQARSFNARLQLNTISTRERIVILQNELKAMS